MHQSTVKRECFFEGVGVHSGLPSQIRVKPAPENTGIVFSRLDLKGASLRMSVSAFQLTHRCSVLQSGDVVVQTPEHLLAAFNGLGIFNAFVEMSAPEIPILDGSAKVFADRFLEAGIEAQSASIDPVSVLEPKVVKDGDAMLIVLPSDRPRFTYFLDFPTHFIGQQIFTFPAAGLNFVSDVAPARTFGFLAEYESILAKGLAKGASRDNTLVIGDTDYEQSLRFEKECARHKILDMMGDFFVLGRPVLGHVVGVCSGHELNRRMVQLLFKS